MPERVVDLAEAVESRRTSPTDARPLAALRERGEPPVEPGAAREPGKEVVEREVLEVGHEPGVRERERDRAGYALERVDLERV